MVKSAEDKKAEKDAIEAELARQSTEAVRSLLSEDNLEVDHESGLSVGCLIYSLVH